MRGNNINIDFPLGGIQMIIIIYEILVFFVILITYFLMIIGEMSITWNFLLSIFAMFVGILLFFYFSLYKIPDFSKERKIFITIISWIFIVITLFILGHLTLILILHN